MLKIEIRERNDESLTFRLPYSYKIELPGAQEIIREGKPVIIFEDGHAIGDLFRQLTKLYLDGCLEGSGLKDGTIELLKLMSVVKPTQEQMSKVDMNKIRKLKEVI